MAPLRNSPRITNWVSFGTEPEGNRIKAFNVLKVCPKKMENAHYSAHSMVFAAGPKTLPEN